MVILGLMVIVVAAIWAYRRRRRGPDLPAWFVSIAAQRIPPERREWADALVAESASIRGSAARWAYAVAADDRPHIVSTLLA